MNESGGGAGANSSYGSKVAAAVKAAAFHYLMEQNKKRRPSAAQEGAANGLAHAAVPAKPSAAAAAPPAASALQHSSTALTTAARPSLQGVPAPTSTGGSPLTLSSAASGSPNTSRSVSPVTSRLPPLLRSGPVACFRHELFLIANAGAAECASARVLVGFGVRFHDFSGQLCWSRHSL